MKTSRVTKTLTEAHIDRLTVKCVDGMGDIFWDYVEERDSEMDFREPTAVATDEVRAALTELAQVLESRTPYTIAIRTEYRDLFDGLGKHADPKRIVSALIADADWTPHGAQTLHWLARSYGTSILRNALALAEALGIEDGEAGL